jgi:hypothetical protein
MNTNLTEAPIAQLCSCDGISPETKKEVSVTDFLRQIWTAAYAAAFLKELAKAEKECTSDDDPHPVSVATRRAIEVANLSVNWLDVWLEGHEYGRFWK